VIVARQSTARTVIVGPVLDSTGAAVTTAVVGDFKIAKNGGAPAALNASATLTHRHTGKYSLALTASDLDTVGQAEVTLDKTTDDCPVKELTVIEEAIYDALFAASANAWSGAAGSSIGTANVTQFGGSAGTFASGRPEVNASHWAGSAVATPTVAGVPEVDLTHWLGTAAATPTVAGVPEVDVTHVLGTASAGTAGYVGIDWSAINAPTTTVSFTGTTVAAASAVASLGANAIQAASIASSALTAAKFGASAFTAAKFHFDTGLAPVRTAVAQAGGATSITLDASASSTDDLYVGQRVRLADGTGVGQDRIITAYNGTTKVATVDHAWATNPDNTTTFVIKPDARVDVEAVSLDGTAADNAESFFDGTGYAGTGNVIPTVTTLTNKTGFSLASSGLDSVLVESGIAAGASLTDDAGTQLTSINARQALSLVVSSAAAGVLAGAATTTVTTKPAGLPAGNTRITATVDGDGNRSAFTLKVPT
jgi:hypothetical protein